MKNFAAAIMALALITGFSGISSAEIMISKNISKYQDIKSMVKEGIVMNGDPYWRYNYYDFKGQLPPIISYEKHVYRNEGGSFNGSYPDIIISIYSIYEYVLVNSSADLSKNLYKEQSIFVTLRVNPSSYKSIDDETIKLLEKGAFVEGFMTGEITRIEGSPDSWNLDITLYLRKIGDSNAR